jgi:hypothetical protein
VCIENEASCVGVMDDLFLLGANLMFLHDWSRIKGFAMPIMTIMLKIDSTFNILKNDQGFVPK